MIERNNFFDCEEYGLAEIEEITQEEIELMWENHQTRGSGCRSSGSTGNRMVFNNKVSSTSLARSKSNSLPTVVSANIGIAVPACKRAFSFASSLMCGDAQAVIRSAISQNSSASFLEMPVR